MPLEGLGMPLVLPEGFPLLPLDLVQREGWRSLWSHVRCTRARFCLLGSFVDWGYGSCSLAANSATFYVRLALPPHLCTFDEVMGWESRSERFLAMFSVVSPASSLHARRGGEAGEIFECRSC